MTRSIASTAIGVALSAFFAVAAHADIVTFSDIVASWHDVAPPGVVGLTFTGNGTGDATVAWGIPSGQPEQSAYEFKAAPNPFDVPVNPPPVSGNFDIGTFTHHNHVIEIGNSNSSITGVLLSILTDVAVNGVAQGLKKFDFGFLHDETPNGADPCAFGGANGQGVNISGCADRVRVTSLNTSDTFDIAGVKYTLDILGFMSGGNLVNQFLTLENADNPAEIIARVSAAVNTIPEPSTLLLIGGGLAWLWLFMRRRTGFTAAS